MPVLSVRHLTTYRYQQPVAFGEHRMMFRPRDSFDQRLLDCRIDITPEPVDLHWLHDVFGNCVAIARFGEGRARELRFESRIRLDHRPAAGLEFPVEPYARSYPFSYGAGDMPDLLRSIERQSPDPERAVDRWAARFLSPNGRADTVGLLVAMTRAIHREFVYAARHEQGVQEPARTLALRTGTCRDFAVLMIEAARSLGFAARFVSGYIFIPGRFGASYKGGGSTHAWVRVYVPGAGWIEFDPTNGIIGSRDLIRVAVVRDPRQAVPLSGTWTGFPADDLGMEVEVEVTEEPGP